MQGWWGCLHRWIDLDRPCSICELTHLTHSLNPLNPLTPHSLTHPPTPPLSLSLSTIGPTHLSVLSRERHELLQEVSISCRGNVW